MRMEEIINTMENKYCTLFNGEHIFDMHSDIKDEELIKRIVQARRDHTPIYGATVFDISEKEVITYIKKILLAKKDAVKKWLADDSEDLLILNGKIKRNVGHGFFNRKWHDWKEGACKCDIIRVVLKPDHKDGYFPFKVVTAYATRME